MSIFDINEPVKVSSVGGDIPAGEVEVTNLGNDAVIELTHVQAVKLHELLARHIDLDVVRLDNGDDEGADLIERLISQLGGLL